MLTVACDPPRTIGTRKINQIGNFPQFTHAPERMRSLAVSRNAAYASSFIPTGAMKLGHNDSGLTAFTRTLSPQAQAPRTESTDRPLPADAISQHPGTTAARYTVDTFTMFLGGLKGEALRASSDEH